MAQYVHAQKYTPRKISLLRHSESSILTPKVQTPIPDP